MLPLSTEVTTGGVLWKKVFLEILQKFKGKHHCRSLFFNKVADLGPTTLLRNGLRHRRFPVNFVKFLRTSFFYRTPQGDCFYLRKWSWQKDINIPCKQQATNNYKFLKCAFTISLRRITNKLKSLKNF